MLFTWCCWDTVITSPYSEHLFVMISHPCISSTRNLTFKGDYQSMNSYLSRIPWQDLLCGNNLEENWSFLKQTVREAQEMFVPVFSGKRKNNSNNPWWSKCLTKAVTLKQKLFCVYQKFKSPADFQCYVVQRNLTKSLIRDSHYKYEMSVIQDTKNNPKRLHSYIKKRQKIVHSIGPLKKVMELKQKMQRNVL